MTFFLLLLLTNVPSQKFLAILVVKKGRESGQYELFGVLRLRCRKKPRHTPLRMTNHL